jgi:uncharacterized membrane protein YfcA
VSSLDLAIAALVLVAALSQGVMGFGYGLIVMSVLPRFLPLDVAVPFTLVHGVVVAGVGYLRYRAHAPWREIGPMLGGALLGVPLGVFALTSLDPDPCIRVLGGLIIVYVVHASWPRRIAPHEQAPLNRLWSLPAGFLAGVFGGAFAMGGPPVLVYASARRMSPSTFKGVLQGFFASSSLVSLAFLGGAGVLKPEGLLRNLFYAPLVLLGAWVGMRWGDRMHPVLFRRVVLTALLVLGLSYLIGGR